MSPSSLQSSTEPVEVTLASLEPEPSPSSPTSSSLRKLHKVRMLRRSWSTLMPGSRSFETLKEMTKATLTGKTVGQNVQFPESPKVKSAFSAKTLPKSLSQASVSFNSTGRGLLTGASLLQSESLAPIPGGTARCHGSFSHCFLRRKPTLQSNCKDKEMYSEFMLPSSVTSFSDKEKPVEKAGLNTEQTNIPTCLNEMSFKDRLTYIQSMKGKTYSFHTGFALARKDALEMINVLHCSVRNKSFDMSEVGETNMETLSQVLLAQARVLNGACSQMATEYSSPEELLLTLTHSFHTLCCLAQACMSLVEGLSTENIRKEVVAKVDEVIINYIYLLKAAETAAGGSPGDQNVNTLIHYSATMSFVINTLTISLKSLLNKKTVTVL